MNYRTFLLIVSDPDLDQGRNPKPRSRRGQGKAEPKKSGKAGTYRKEREAKLYLKEVES